MAEPGKPFLSTTQAVVAEPKVQSAPVAASPGKTLSIDRKDIPAEASLASLPKKPYWIGRCKDAPFHSVHIASISFPGTSFSVINGAPANNKIGIVAHLTDEQVKKIKKESMEVAWRKKIIRKKVGKEVRTEVVWDRIDLHNANEVLNPGDMLTAHFVFMVALEPGQKIPLGTVDEDGNPMPTPQALIS